MGTKTDCRRGANVNVTKQRIVACEDENGAALHYNLLLHLVVVQRHRPRLHDIARIEGCVLAKVSQEEGSLSDGREEEALDGQRGRRRSCRK